MLEKAVQYGTGIRVTIPGISVAGKTGTDIKSIDYTKEASFYLLIMPS